MEMSEREADGRDIALWGVFLAAAYASLQIVSNVASLKVGLVFGFAVDMGTFCYPLTFTVRDLAHKALGLKAVCALVWGSALICLFASGYFALVSASPSPGADSASEAFSAVFSPMWRIVIASVCAMVASELVDTAVYQAFVKRTRRHQWARVLASNGISIPVDNLVFAVAAFGWTLPWHTVVEIFLFNLAVKAIVGIAGMPLIYLVPGEKKEAA